uniref:Uncharacterized protein n=1 Tax=Anguilla anguilla TaxID=7936 RepID=A0A0E9TW23_ANGAN
METQVQQLNLKRILPFRLCYVSFNFCNTTVEQQTENQWHRNAL